MDLFDRVIERRNTDCEKWDGLEQLFGAPDALPMWVADMDFAAPEPVLEALRAKIDHGVLGYTRRTDAYLEAVAGWMAERHGWPVEKEWIVFCPGVVPALNLIVQAFTEPGDKVVIQTPVYPPFYNVVKNHGRELVLNPLRKNGDRYEMDLDDLESKLDDKVKLLILCSPHNPVGRVWTREELERLAELSEKHGFLVASDEIHADLVYAPHTHTPFANISEWSKRRTIVCTAPSKTFNIAGLNTANMIIPDKELRDRFAREVAKYSLGSITPTGHAATIAAYREGGPWLDALLAYLQQNIDYALEVVAKELPELRAVKPEATYLLWLDCRGLGMSVKELNAFLLKEAKLALNNGAMFGTDGEGYVRMNLACSRATVKEGMNRLTAAVRALRQRREDSRS
ncbi:cystathionine beta-lyase [Paenibacillus sp. J31TS4]|uniref:MalY/PatB family protein n=1 Tax=Paenibacillus sp. J31TS4 TaxID=2807195 RepID=UPI001B087680|nr:PatB family C-S lyase [Paenibacillus sp. J31TS4]GIP39495.1 cystathionine beta-lyase [Paenibacillus sp. J31TS4]